MKEPKRDPVSLIDEFLKEVDAWSDRWCILCDKPFRVRVSLDQDKERYNICPDCYIYSEK